MNRPLRSGILGAAVLALSALAAPTVAGAAPAKPTVSPSTTAGSAAPTILARADIVFLSGDPWHPSGSLEVKVVNEGGTAAKGFFVLRLPPGAEPDRGRRLPGRRRCARGPGSAAARNCPPEAIGRTA